MVKHLAIQMDGNRRWAKNNGLELFLGHYHGVNSIQVAVDFCISNKIPFLSLWALSIDNYLKRSRSELDYLYDLLIKKSEENLDQYIQKNVKVKFIGDRDLFPARVIPTIDKVEDRTKDFNALQLNILFCYSGKQEIISGIKKIMEKIKLNELNQNDITVDNFSDYLWFKDVPDPDICVKTGGNKRLSNFILYQSTFSELFFLDCLWPDIKDFHLNQILNEFKDRKRNFGA